MVVYQPSLPFLILMQLFHICILKILHITYCTTSYRCLEAYWMIQYNLRQGPWDLSKSFHAEQQQVPSLSITLDWRALQFNELTRHEYVALLIPVAYRAKIWIFKLLVLPVLPYGCEKWTQNSNLKKKTVMFRSNQQLLHETIQAFYLQSPCQLYLYRHVTLPTRSYSQGCFCKRLPWVEEATTHVICSVANFDSMLYHRPHHDRLWILHVKSEVDVDHSI